MQSNNFSEEKLKTKRIMVVAGEPSGDMHAGCLIENLKKDLSDARIYGMGGVEMKKAGVDILVNSSKLSVVGIVEILKHYPAIKKAFTKLKKSIETEPPDLLILIDYPEFNLRLAKIAKNKETKVLFYISPQVWAWRQSRVKNIKKLVDMMAVILPFEADFYKKESIPVRYVGHPLSGKANPTNSIENSKKKYGLDPNKKTIGLFPGSRESEIQNHMPIVCKIISYLNEKEQNVQFIIPASPGVEKNSYMRWIEQDLNHIKLVDDNIYNIIQTCDAIASASGTVNVQIALMKKPFCVFYRVSFLTFLIVKNLVRTKSISLVNILSDKIVVKEFIQKEARHQLIAEELKKLLYNKEYNAALEVELDKIKLLIGDKNSTAEVTILVKEMLLKP